LSDLNPTNTGGAYGKETRRKIAHGQKIQHQVSLETRRRGRAWEKPNRRHSEADDPAHHNNSQASGSHARKEEDHLALNDEGTDPTRPFCEEPIRSNGFGNSIHQPEHADLVML
jgi:hypothetical protein